MPEEITSELFLPHWYFKPLWNGFKENTNDPRGKQHRWGTTIDIVEQEDRPTLLHPTVETGRRLRVEIWKIEGFKIYFHVLEWIGGEEDAEA